MYESSKRYEIQWHRAARREMRRLPQSDQRRVAMHVAGLANDPQPPGCRRMTGPHVAWRIRVGRYRVVYQIHGNVAIVFIVRVAKRDEVYRQPETLRGRLRPSE